MLTTEFDYNLPQELIAQTPAVPRDSSKLMVVGRVNKKIEHRNFFDIINYLEAGDLLVWNNSKVFKARLKGRILLDANTDDVDDKLENEIHPTEKILNTPKEVEIFLVRPMENSHVWKVLAKPGRKLRLGMKVRFADLSAGTHGAEAKDFEAEVMLKEKDGTILMQFADDDAVVRAKANKYGEVPLPPYIQATPHLGLLPRGEEVATPLPAGEGSLPATLRVARRAGVRGGLSERYQTVYARYEGSVAAPTAGFHFTSELIERLEKKGVQFAEVTLHVGLGTFLPVKTDKIEEHQMHNEWVELTAKNADLINTAKAEGRRVIAVGTTTVRTLEGVAQLSLRGSRFASADEAISSFSRQAISKNQGIATSRLRSGLAMTPRNAPSRTGNVASEGGETPPLQPARLRSYIGDINIFITPGFKFQVVDAMITNFHLPKSTLLMLVSAFAQASPDKSASAASTSLGTTAEKVDTAKGREFMLECYEEAIKEKYRLYSFGDAMFIR